MIQTKGAILVIDDEVLNLELIEAYLDCEGYDCVCVSSGRQALRLLEEKWQSFDCILLDRMMPQMDGIEVLHEIKASENTRRLPVIMQTAMTGKTNMQEGLEAGAHYYLTKPYDQKTLLTIVNSAVNAYRQYRSLQHKLNETAHSLRMMQQGMFRFRTLDEARRLAVLLAKTCPDPDRVVMGLSELLVNAVEHGNLAISYQEKSELTKNGRWQDEIRRRLQSQDYCNRQVTVVFKRNEEKLEFSIKDEGDGFDWEEYLEISPERALNSHGRGIAMANAISFDELTYCGKGNEVFVTIANQVI